MAVKHPASKLSSFFLVLFSLPFAAVGVGMGAWLAYDAAAYQNMQSWEETPAKIVEAKLESHSDSEGGTTYQATARYEYDYHGRHYSGSRVGISGGSDNIGSFQQDVHRQLSECRKSGRPFRCYVNPSSPSEAILFRDLRWEMVAFRLVFVLAFGGVGFGLLAYSLIGVRRAKQEKALAAAHPSEPWLWKPDWAAGRIASSSAKTAAFLVCFALFWNVISAVPAWFAVQEGYWEKGQSLALLALLFPAVGLGLIAAAAVAVLRLRKYGLSAFEMAVVPGIVGGQLAGVVRVPRKVLAEDGFQLKLKCVRKITTGGKNSSTHETVLWEDEQTVARELRQADPEKSAVPVLFGIPYECRPTDESNANDQTIWRLEVAAATPGLDYSAAFDVPVFQTAESDPNFTLAEKIVTPPSDGYSVN